MNMEKQTICISCPLGCRLTVRWTGEQDIAVTGNQCQRGELYGKEEVLAPKRVVSATARMVSSPLRRLPVKTNKPLPKEHIPDLLKEIYRLAVKPPVKSGHILIRNIKGTKVDLVATRTVP